MCKHEELEEYDGIKIGQTVIFSFGDEDTILETKVRIKNIYKDAAGVVNFLFKAPLAFHLWWKEKTGESYLRVITTARSELKIVD